MVHGRVVALVVFSLLMGVACADDGWWSQAGGIGAFGKSHPTIRMVSEDLKIKLRDQLSAEVDVTFEFRNEGPATKVTMGFPEEYEVRTDGSLDHFRTWVDGRVTKVVRKVTSKGDPENADNISKAVWLKEVSFGRNQTRRVRVTYNGWYFGDTSGTLGLEYTLTSGASWKGPIGTCKITIDYRGLKKMCRPYLDLSAAKWTNPSRGVASATLINFEPHEELSILMVPGFWNFTINGKQVPPTEGRGYMGAPYVAGTPNDPMIRVDSVDRFFGGWGKLDGEDDWTDWANPVSKKFGGSFEIFGNMVRLGDGRFVPLGRPTKAILNKEGNRHTDMVYVKDLIEALGGKFSYDESDQRVEIRF